MTSYFRWFGHPVFKFEEILQPSISALRIPEPSIVGPYLEGEIRCACKLCRLRMEHPLLMKADCWHRCWTPIRRWTCLCWEKLTKLRGGPPSVKSLETIFFCSNQVAHQNPWTLYSFQPHISFYTVAWYNKNFHVCLFQSQLAGFMNIHEGWVHQTVQERSAGEICWSKW